MGDHACAHEDDSRALTLADMLAPEGAARMAPVAGGLVDFGFGASRYWVSVRLRNATDTAGTWWITHDIPAATMLRVHLVPDGGGADAAQTLLALTNRDRFGARPIPHRHLVSEIALQPDETAMLVVEYTTDQATEMPFFAETVAQFFERTQTETVQIAALTALILGMGLISTVYLYGLDGRPALAYGAYMLAGVALLVHLEGYAFQYVWPNAPGFNQAALPIIGTLLVVLGLFFVDRFTLARNHAPRLHMLVLFGMGLLLLLGVLSTVMIQLVWFKNLILLAIGLGTILQAVLAVLALRRGQSGAAFLVLGFGALAAAIIFGVVGYLTEGLFEQEYVGMALRLAFLFEAAAFSVAIALRVRAARRERDLALNEQLRLSEERLSLSEALRRAEDDRQRAANAALRSREALATAAHDIRQPLASMQLALTAGEAPQDRIASCLQYLEEIVRAGLDDNSAPLGTGEADPPSRYAQERFEAGIVLKNIEAMFGAEAARQGVALRVVGCGSHLVADPLALMRIVGNLVSNALRHAEPRRILVGCRRRPQAMSFEVHDDGQGIGQADLERLSLRGEKGTGSDGHGLGLAIVGDLADENGFQFGIASVPGRGTVARIEVPVLGRAWRPAPGETRKANSA
nr:sensor histidine kinase [Thalassococcus arenae]